MASRDSTLSGIALSRMVLHRGAINRMMEEGVVSMLYESGMPTAFWEEALATFIHTSTEFSPQHSQTALHLRLSM